VEVVFVSVDPQRDTVEKLSRYVPNFDRRFYGLRLEPAEITDVTKTFDLTVQYGQPKDGPETDSYYYVDHTGTFFVFDREGRLRLKFPPNATVDQMRPDIEKLLAACSSAPTTAGTGPRCGRATVRPRARGWCSTRCRAEPRTAGRLCCAPWARRCTSSRR
jgi:hypothetical protein